MRFRVSASLLLAAAAALSLAPPALAYDAACPSRPQTISGGAAESFAVDGCQTLWAWGANEFGQLGDGSRTGRAVPVRVLEGVRSVSAGESHTYAVLEDGSLWAWGRDMSDSFAGLSPEGYSAAPIQLMEDVASASTGVCTHLAVKTDGSLWAWGRYVGNRTNKQCAEPQKVLDRVTAAVAGFGHSLALKADGSLWAWGQNADGEIGDGTTRERLTPVKVMEDVVQITAGYGFSAAVKADGTLWTWGRNWQGELGDGTTESRSTPARIMDRVVSVHAANNTAYALREDGTLWAWGSNRTGEVGDGTVSSRLSPVPVLDDVAEVGAGWNHVLARRTDGTLWTWGANVSGQLGSGESGFYVSYLPRFSAKPIQVMENTLSAAAPSPLPAGSRPAAWAQAAVDEAIGLGFVPLGLRDRYSQAIIRGEFCALAVQSYERWSGAEVDGRVSFPDTRDSSVEKAAYLGIVSGTESGAFAPDAPLDREQAAVILANLARAAGHPLPQAEPAFDDSAAIGGWARDAAGQVQNAGIMGGAGGSFLPRDTYTREQSIVTILNLYRLLQD